MKIKNDSFWSERKFNLKKRSSSSVLIEKQKMNSLIHLEKTKLDYFLNNEINKKYNFKRQINNFSLIYAKQSKIKMLNNNNFDKKKLNNNRILQTINDKFILTPITPNCIKNKFIVTKLTDTRMHKFNSISQSDLLYKRRLIQFKNDVLKDFDSLVLNKYNVNLPKI